ncbi:P2X purinoceptor 3-like [Periophthalmus magnuspinnatus]|uniref:P2X purinoceptor 3-like n=1 Tax=Periophthalmus magnuspinnatus TaxID=409849 RepID=UPI002437134D|nr:P2X purinoceptor 3-like [Periophthalmus magnuspinnatus]
MVLWGCIIDLFTYESTRFVVVKNWSVGIINRIVQVAIIAYFVGYVFIHEKAYQTKDTGIESSVMTKVKGFGRHNGQIMDVADSVFPPEGTNVFCIMTRLYVTENQFQGRCPDDSWPFTCKRDDDCKKYYGSFSPSGVITGKCLKEDNESPGVCEVEGWCPSENEAIPTEPMADIRNFTIFIKNIINFPLFDITRYCRSKKPLAGRLCFNTNFMFFRGVVNKPNVPSRSCQCHNDKDGGHIGIKIEWKCNLDIDLDYCVPHYFFTRLDNKNAIFNGYNFRFARYYKSDNGTEYRTLYKVVAIRFDVKVTGNAGKFNMVPTLINVVAALTCLGLGTVLCDIILLKFLKGAEQYKAKKFEEVSPAQIEASLTPSPDSRLSLKPGTKSSLDSGMPSL